LPSVRQFVEHFEQLHAIEEEEYERSLEDGT
jgi:hypothetical protein